MAPKSTLKAVFFDIDDTLYSTHSFAMRARGASVDAMIAMGLRADRRTVLRELNEVVQEFSSNYEHHFDKLLSRLPLEATLGLSFPLVISAAVVAYHETKFRELTAYDDVTEVMRILHKTGVTLGIISSGITLKQAEKIVRLRIQLTDSRQRSPQLLASVVRGDHHRKRHGRVDATIASKSFRSPVVRSLAVSKVTLHPSCRIASGTSSPAPIT